MAPLLDVCRLCGQKKKMKVDLFAANCVLLQKITDTLRLTVTMDDPLPKSACLECQRLVEAFYGFKLKCFRADVKLRNLVVSGGHSNTSAKQTSIKEEHHSEFLIGTEPANHYLPTDEHSYFALTAAIVKTEIREETIYEENSQENEPVDSDSGVIFEKLVYNQAVADVKQPIVEVLTDDATEVLLKSIEPCSSKEELASIVKVDVIVPDAKPIHDLPHFPTFSTVSGDFIEEVVEFDDLGKDCEPGFNTDVITKSDVEKYDQIDGAIIKKEKSPIKTPRLNTVARKRRLDADGFSESDYVLKDNEPYDIDEEEIEAAIIKKNNPSAKFKCPKPKCRKSFKFFKAWRKHKLSHEGGLSSFHCKMCPFDEKNKSFSSHAALAVHKYRKHGRDPPYKCPTCASTFRGFSEYRKHVQEHNDGTKFVCGICLKTFPQKFKLVNHMRLHTNEKPFNCHKCTKSFRWASNLASHESTHAQDKTKFLCAECGLTFLQNNSLSAHIKSLHRRHFFTCPVCGQSYAHLTSLQRHHSVHTTAIPNRCEVCGHDYQTPVALVEHRAIHAKERPFICEQCPMAFKTRTNLSNHRKIHDKKHECSKCGHCFAKTQLLRDHELSVHMRVRHVCPAPQCKASFSQRTPLTRHFRRRHPDMLLTGRNLWSFYHEKVLPYTLLSSCVMERLSLPHSLCLTSAAMMQLYYNPVSAPCRAVMLLFQALNLKPEMMLINFETGDHMTPEYLKMNPQHTIPVLVDEGFVLTESRAILGYVAEKYAMDMALYPSDPMARGVVNHRLFYDIGTLYQRLYDTYLGPLMNGEGKMNAEKYEKTAEAMEWLNTFIGDAPYMAGDKMTIADFSIMATVSSMEAVGWDLSKYPKVMAWFNKCKKEMPGFDDPMGNGGAQMWGAMLKAGLNIK